MDGMMTKLKDVVVGCTSVEKSGPPAMIMREISDDEDLLFSDVGGFDSCSASNIGDDDKSRWNSSDKATSLVASQEEQQRHADDDQAGNFITTTTTSTTTTPEHERSILSVAYKTHALLETTQSALNAVACLIVVIFAKLWACLQTRVRNWEWVQKVCAETEKVLEIVNCYYDEGNQPRIGATATTTATTTTSATAAAATTKKNPAEDKMTIEIPAEVDMILPPTLPTMRINSISLDDPSMDAPPAGVRQQYFTRSTSSASSSSDGEDLMYPDSAVYTDGELSSGNEAGLIGTNGLTRRDSDTSDVSSTDGSVDEVVKELDPELVTRIVAQVEYMFSDDHLAKDGFLLKHVRRRSDGFVSLKLVAGLRKVKQISREFNVILDALRTSSKLEVNSEGSKVRRVDPLTAHLKSLPVSSQKEKVTKTSSSSGDEVSSRKTSTASSQGEKENSKRGGRQQQQQQNKQVTRKDSAGSQKSENGNRQSKGPNNNRNASALIANVEREFSLRRRGGSLPMPVIAPGILSAQNVYYGNMPGSPGGRFQRQTIAYLSPNASPPNGLTAAALGGGAAPGTRPKSNSYCEGLMTSATMSPWLQRRKAAASRTNSDSGVVLSTVIRQPRGPDGTRGFAASSCPRVIEA